MHTLQVVGKRLEIGGQHHKFGAAIHLVGSRLIGFRERVDIRHIERVAHGKLWIEVMNALGHHFGAALAIALWLQACGVDAVGYQIVHHRLRTALAQLLVVCLGADAVGVRRHFNGDIRIFHQCRNHRVECRLRFGAKRGLVEVVEYVFYHLWLVHGRKHEVHTVFGIFIRHVALKFLTAVEIAVGSCQHHISHAALEVEAETAVGIGCRLLIAAVVAHDTDNCAAHRLLVLVHHIARNPYFQVGLLKTVDVVVAAAVFAVATEIAAFALAEGDAEVVVRRVHRTTQILDKPAARRLERGAENVESAKAGMAVA